ncbi:DUF6090 family protein [Psychroserpens sp. AS72]|uniref:DUF6090 family protein n=1 Tax=Psychroserpens sp. AS72 TaxID=3135775 RepID=UPI0031805C0A
MIKFFRHIRRSYISEGKTKKYLLYAIGEIILVVIGILIALQINNWNENKKGKQLEDSFFSNILLDLEKDEQKLNYYKKFHTQRMTLLDTLLTYVRNPQNKMGIEKFGMYIEPLYYNENATNYSATFESAKTLGAFNSFNKKELLKSLAQYYADFILIKAQFDSSRRFVESQLEPFMATIPESYITTNTGNLVIQEEDVQGFYDKIAAIKDTRNLTIDYESLMQDPRFENYLIGDMGRTSNTLGKIGQRLTALKQIKKQLTDND